MITLFVLRISADNVSNETKGYYSSNPMSFTTGHYGEYQCMSLTETTWEYRTGGLIPINKNKGHMLSSRSAVWTGWDSGTMRVASAEGEGLSLTTLRALS